MRWAWVDQGTGRPIGGPRRACAHRDTGWVLCRFRQMRSKAVASTVLIGGSANAAIERASAQVASIANASAASACDVSA